MNMNMIFILLLYCTPIFAGISVALYLRHLRRQDERDELEYLKSLTEEEKKTYFAEKSRALLKQHRAYSFNGVATIQRNR